MSGSESQPAVRSRRAFIATLAGAFAGAIGATLGDAGPASAANGDAVKAGQTTTATAPTKVTNTADSGAGLWGIAAGASRHGVFGTNTGGGHGVGGSASADLVAGVHGMSSAAQGYGVIGENSVGGDGVQGRSASGAGVRGTGKFGVWASGDDTALYAEGANIGVHGVSDGAGSDPAGVVAVGTGGATALRVLGVAEFDRSGRATVPAGKRSVTVKGVPLADTSVILAVAQASENRYVVAAVPDVPSSSFTVQLNKAAPTNLRVGWFVAN